MKKRRQSAFGIVGVAVLFFAVISVPTLATVAAEIATAESATATRTLPAEPISAGEFFSVRIEAAGYGAFGQVVETLPAGFKYVQSSLNPGSVEVVGDTVRFYLLGDTSFNYTLTAPHTEGTYSFSGLLKDEDKNEYEVGGDTEVVVEAATAVATRTLPAEPVSAGKFFSVRIETAGYGSFGQVLETLPEGFMYLTSTLDPGSVVIEAETNTVKFTLFGDTSFNYTAIAPKTEGTYTFSGLLVDEDKNEYEVGGATELVVEEEAAEPTVSIATDKKNYTTGETMKITVGLKNPAETAEQVLFAWGVNFTDYENAFFWLTAFELTLPPESNQSFQVPLQVGDWGPARFNAAWHVALFEFDGETYEKISEDRAEWSFVPALELGLGGSESEIRPVKVAEKIEKEVTKVEANL